MAARRLAGLRMYALAARLPLPTWRSSWAPACSARNSEAFV